MGKKICILWALWGIFLAGYAQPVCTFKPYNFNDGYLNGSFLDMTQTDAGLLWIASRNGLIKFDGYTFSYVPLLTTQGTYLASSEINEIIENSEGNLWCRNSDGRPYLFLTDVERFVDLHENLTAENLPRESVDLIQPLKKGVTWILYKDGTALRVQDSLIRTAQGVEKIHYPNEMIAKVYQDRDGDEWIFTDTNMHVMGAKKVNASIPYFHAADVHGTLYFTDFDHNLGRYNPTTETIEPVHIPFSPSKISSIRGIKENTLAIATNSQGLLLYNLSTKTFRQVRVDIAPHAKNQIFRLAQDPSGDVWMWNGDPGILHYDAHTEEVRILHAPQKPYIRHQDANKPMFHIDRQGTVWVIPKGENLCYYNRDTRQLTYATIKEDGRDVPLAPPVRFSYWDKQGNYWLDNHKTLCKVSFFPANYSLIPKEKDEYEVRALMQDKRGNFWVGCKNNRLKLLDENYRLLGYFDENGQLSKEVIPFKGNIYAMHEDSAGRVYMGTRNRGLYTFTPTGTEPYAYRATNYQQNLEQPYSISSNSIYSILEDSAGRIWLGTYGGGINLVREQGDSLEFLHPENTFSSYPVAHFSTVRNLSQISKNALLVGTKKGVLVWQYNPDNPKESRGFYDQSPLQETFPVTGKDVFYTYTDQQGNSYAIVQNGGVQKLQPATLFTDRPQMKELSKENSFPANFGLSMLADTNDIKWVICRQGLLRLGATELQMDFFNNPVMQQNLVFSEAAPLRSRSGKIVMGTDQGILEFNPYMALHYSRETSIVFTRIVVQGAPVATSPHNLSNLVLEPGQRNLVLQFARLDFAEPANIKYAYKLEGLDDTWQYSGANRSASYTNLAPGNYRFMVKATNSNGLWEDTPRMLNIRIEPRFMETRLAKVVIVLVILLVVIASVYIVFTIYRLRYAVNMEKQMAELKMKFFTDVSHELRTPLTLISGPVTDVLENEPITDDARQHLTLVKKNTDRMLRMVNQMLDVRRIQSRKTRLCIEELEVHSFLRRVMEGFQFVARDKQIAFNLEASGNGLALWSDKDKLEKIVYNLLSNAFKYSANRTRVTVQVEADAQHVYIHVQDQGEGILPQKLERLFKRFETHATPRLGGWSSGIGLSVVKEYVDLLQGTIAVTSAPEKGSTFTLTFPLGNAHFQSMKGVEFVESSEAPEESSTPEWQPVSVPSPTDEPSQWSILVVEDNTDLRAFICKALARSYQVLQANNGKQGLEKVAEHLPDLIISDIMMPEMDGLQMVRSLKNNREWCHIPIILLTAKGEVEDKILGIENGVDEYLTKPFNTRYLNARIRSLIQQRSLLQEVYRQSVTSTDPQAALKNLEPSAPTIHSYDKEFLDKLMQFMEANIENPQLVVDDFAAAFSMSRSVFFKKMKMLLGITPNHFIRDMRIKRAVQLLESGMNSITDVAYRCGFSDPNYFAKTFRKSKGLSPSEYRNQKVGDSSNAQG